METQTKWSIDPSHSQIEFKVRHLMISHVKGSFKTFEASIYTTGKDFATAEIDLWIDPSTISTGDTKRDEHLKSSEFFDIENHKQINFTSSTIGKENATGKHELWGELTMMGITKNIKLDVIFGGSSKDLYGQEKAGFNITGKIKRSDWGLVWNNTLETGGVAVSDEINIVCEIQLINLGKKDLTMELDSSVKQKTKAVNS
jgi:polyisoprenoid-binding protein YceI